MKTIEAEQLASLCGGAVVAGPGDAVALRVSTDTRTIEPGSAFFALKGERFDANDFTAGAIESGASVVVAERWDGGDPGGAAVVLVEDGLVALQRLARWHRHEFDIPVVGITGSNGKTSTKDFTAAVLGESCRVRATRGNLNNHIGVPLSVLSLEEGDGAAVFEMGMNHAGEIAPLCEIAAPTMGIITSIGTAHIEFLGSREGIAEEKGALARALPSEGALFIPAGCDFYDYFRTRTRARVVPVGNGRGLIRAEDLVQQDGRARFMLVVDGRRVAPVDLPVTGRHMIKNALLAAGCGWFLGMEPEAIAQGLSTAVLTSGRLRSYRSRGVMVIDDTYNANPESMAAAIETLAETALPNGGRRWVVLGPMGELGTHARDAHLRVGELARERGMRVMAVGEGAEGIAEGAGEGDFFADRSAAAAELSSQVKPGDVVLFKASRSAAMEKLMNQVFPPESPEN